MLTPDCQFLQILEKDCLYKMSSCRKERVAYVCKTGDLG